MNKTISLILIRFGFARTSPGQPQCLFLPIYPMDEKVHYLSRAKP
jgi:hypothetical protein